MALTTSYLTSVKNLDSILNSIISAKAPERFTTRFLEDLGFKSSNDRLYIGMFKALGLLDENGVPTQRYFQFLDQTQSRRIIAEGIQEAYEDLFSLRRDAQNMTNEEVKNKLKTLTQGQKSDRVIEQMALTFRTFCNYADWSDPVVQHSEENIAESQPPLVDTKPNIVKPAMKPMNLCYNIQIYLPETTNMAVYDAIFRSLKHHLIS